jgi:hypothetical protein
MIGTGVPAVSCLLLCDKKLGVSLPFVSSFVPLFLFFFFLLLFSASQPCSQFQIPRPEKKNLTVGLVRTYEEKISGIL